jgi:hypothetical protein
MQVDVRLELTEHRGDVDERMRDIVCSALRALYNLVLGLAGGDGLRLPFWKSTDR